MRQHPKPMVTERSYIYHPMEWSFVGYSGSGKTFLIRKLLEYWRRHYKVGYVKHSAHHLDVDTPGKDSELAARSGACFRYMRSEGQQVFLDAPHAPDDWGLRFLHADGVLVEGGKEQASLPKMLVVAEEDHSILDHLPEGTAALCGTVQVTRDLPWFHRDDVAGIAEFIESRWQARLLQQRPVALIMSGGYSRRMGSDKGLLAYHGKDQVEYLWQMLVAQGFDVLLSAREGQYGAELWPGLARCYDRILDCGPLGALGSALWRGGDRSLLLVPCDRPDINVQHVRSLEQARHWSRMAIIAQEDHGTDASFALYEASARPFVFRALERGNLALNKLADALRVSRVRLELGPNCNSPEDRHKYVMR